MPPRKKNQKIFNKRLLNLVIIIKGLASNGQGPREKKISSPWRLRQGRQAEVTEAFLCRLIDIAGCSDAPLIEHVSATTQPHAPRDQRHWRSKDDHCDNRPIAVASGAPQAPSQATLGFVPLPTPPFASAQTQHGHHAAGSSLRTSLQHNPDMDD